MKNLRFDFRSSVRFLAVLAAAAVFAALLAGCSRETTPDNTDKGTDPIVTSADIATADDVSVGTDAPIPPDFSFPEVGGTFTLGKYEQDGNAENGAEDIEWIVLSGEDGYLLAVSKYSLDSMELNDSDEGTTWDKSTLKAWLNGEFYEGAFTDFEKAKISDTDAGRVFLLTVEDAETLFETDADRISEGTAYAHSSGLFKTEGGGVWWWLRSTGEKDGYFAGVDGNGTVSRAGNTAHRIKHGVRPAIRIEP
ncbi:MAG: hypothetical protein IKI03_09975 [Clostridia bacterium]|nr:hypothetical protein [Clostridia bacterium]